jgi:hypothetical protein
MNRLFFISSLGLIRASFQFLNLNSKKKGILMIVRFNPCSEDLQRLQVGPIGPHLRGFAALVTKQNYCNVTGWLKVRLVAKFSRWLQRHRITLKELNEARIDRFLHTRWKRLARHVGDRITMDLLLRYRARPLRRFRLDGFGRKNVWPAIHSHRKALALLRSRQGQN